MVTVIDYIIVCLYNAAVVGPLTAGNYMAPGDIFSTSAVTNPYVFLG